MTNQLIPIKGTYNATEAVIGTEGGAQLGGVISERVFASSATLDSLGRSWGELSP